MYVSTGEPTYWPSDKRNVPDLLDFGVTKGIPSHSIQAVSDFDLSSDHSLVLLIMHTRITPQNGTPTLSSKTTNWVTFQNYITKTLPSKFPLKWIETLKTMCITSYKPYSRPPGSLRQTPIHYQTKTPVLRLSNRKYLTKDGYADDGNTPGPLKIRHT